MLTQSFGDSVATNEGMPFVLWCGIVSLQEIMSWCCCNGLSCHSGCNMLTLFVAADNVTAIEFDPTGNYLATGDRGGRIVVFRGVKQDGVSLICWGLLNVFSKIDVPYRPRCQRVGHLAHQVVQANYGRRIFSSKGDTNMHPCYLSCFLTRIVCLQSRMWVRLLEKFGDRRKNWADSIREQCVQQSPAPLNQRYEYICHRLFHKCLKYGASVCLWF